jgi:multidrug efflux pump subunit AcrA (membrane-fusion protein)
MLTRSPRFTLRLAVQAAIAAIGALALAGCNSKNAYVAPPPPKVQVAQPLERPVTEYLELTGNTQAFASVDLVARVQGFLTSIDYVDGATVKKGAQLFGIERDIYQAQVDQQEATVASDEATEEYNKAEYGRQAALARQDFARSRTPKPRCGSPRSTWAIRRCWPLSTAWSPITSSMSARWSGSPARPSSPQSSRPIRFTSTSR